MDEFKIILPPQSRSTFMPLADKSADGCMAEFCLYNEKRLPVNTLSRNEIKNMLTKKPKHTYSALEQFVHNPSITFGFKAFRTRYGWRTKEVLPDGREYKQQLHFSSSFKQAKKIDKIKFPSGNLYTLILAQAENGDFITIRQKNKQYPKGYTVPALDRKFAKSGLLKRIEQLALKIGQNPDGSEKPYLRKVGGLIFSLARKFKIKGGL